MEDEEEIRSRASPVGSESPDPSSSPPAGRITVTVASAGPPTYSPAPPASSSQQDPNALALALPVQAGGGGGGNSSNGRASGGGREDCWSEGATAVLIDAWGERYLELSRGNLKQKHWKEVAEIVSSRDDYGKTPKTDIQCKNRIDTVKKKYKQEKARMAAGGGSSRWIFFDKLDRLIGSTAKIPTCSPSSGGFGGSSQKIPMGIPMSSRTNLYQQQGKATTPPFEKLDRLIGATTARIPTASLSSGGGGGSGGGGSQNVPMGIPMSGRSNSYQQLGRTPQPLLLQGVGKRSNESKRWRFKKRDASDSESESEPEMSADSADSLPPPPPPKRVKVEKKKEGGGGGGNKWAELTRAILRFGEAYEQAETAKLQQVVEMEKERMKFLKELELQRMQFFVKTQLEISQLRQQGRRNRGGRGGEGGGGGNGNTSDDHNGKNNNNNNNSSSNNNNIAAVNNNSDVSN